MSEISPPVRKRSQLKTKVQGKIVGPSGQGHGGVYGAKKECEEIQGCAPGKVKSWRLLFLAVIGSCLSPTFGLAASITPGEAASHVGETATVCGVVVAVTYVAAAPMAPTFLDLDQQYPNQVFTAIIFGNDRAKFGSSENSLRGKSVCVTGEIFLFQGRPKMTLRDPKQLTGG